MFHTRLTTRGSILVTLAICALAVGLLFRHEGIAFAGLALAFWISLEWIGFQWLLVSNKHILRDCVRLIDDKTDDVITVTSDHEYRIRLTATAPRSAAGFRFWISDTPPDALRVVKGTPALVIDLSENRRIEIEYTVRTGACGKLSLPGVRVGVSDSTGFFRHEHFVPAEQQLTVLPFLIRPQTTVSVLKRNNVQRLTGHHRHRHAGLGAELLGIRDYQPGDPPRTIAWKPTARLGKLMTCEFENEVPIRATILIDLSSYQFQGRPGIAVADRVISAGTSIARLLLSDRDPIAAVAVSETGSTRIPHGFGERQLTRLMQFMLKAAAPYSNIEHLPIDDLVDLVYYNASQRFPHLFDDRINRGSIRGARFRRRNRIRARKRSKLVIAAGQLLGVDPGLARRLRFDEQGLRDLCCKYAEEYSVNAILSSPTQRLSVRRSQLMYKQTLQAVCGRLLDGHTRANDNELFVFVGRVPTGESDAQRFEDTIRVMRAAYHRVIVVEAGEENLNAHITDPTARRILIESQVDRDEISSQRLASRLAALGAKYARVDDPKLIEKVAMEVDLVRSGRIRAGASI